MEGLERICSQGVPTLIRCWVTLQQLLWWMRWKGAPFRWLLRPSLVQVLSMPVQLQSLVGQLCAKEALEPQVWPSLHGSESTVKSHYF